MGTSTAMTTWLRRLDGAALAALLTHRRDALITPAPRSLAELAERLDRADSLVAVLRLLPLPCLQMTEAVLALGEAPRHADLVAFMQPGGTDHDEDVAHWLDVLAEHGIAWLDADGTIGAASALAAIFPAPLGLGPPVRALLADVPVDQMRRILQTLGVVKPPTRRADVLDELVAVLNDPDTVRGIAETAPSAVTQELTAWAREAGRSTRSYQDDDPDDDRYYDDLDDLYIGPFDQAAYQRRTSAAEWALQRGLVLGRRWSYGWQMPAEVSRALRGPGYRAPFTATRPPIDGLPLAGEQLLAHSAAAVGRFADLLLAIVDRLARTPLPALKSGGVGARELGKLAKAVGCEDGELRLALELLAATDVIDNGAGPWRLSADAAAWRELPPAARIATMLTAWWQLSYTPTESRDEDGKAVPALKFRSCGGCLLARQNVLQALAELGEDASADADQLAARALWRRPLVHVLAQDERAPFASIGTEATLLGVIAAGALTPLGRAIMAADEAAATALLSAALPAPNDRALFGADLTVVVAGAPTATVSRVLDAAADREGRGGATVWRFTPGSIRRALDEGQSADGLERALADIATAKLPQPLRYLIADIGRQHGNLRVSAAVSIVRSDDETLLRQLAGDRTLRKLGLRLLAPSVLAADTDSDTLLVKLRAAGYLPMPDGDVPAEAPEQPEPSAREAQLAAIAAWRRANLPEPTYIEPAELAARLLARASDVIVPASPTESRLSQLSSLNASEVRLLAHAIDHDGAVSIDYQNQAGRLSRRTISQMELSGDAVLAWCELRSDERWFRIDRIRSVAPIG